MNEKCCGHIRDSEICILLIYVLGRAVCCGVGAGEGQLPPKNFPNFKKFRIIPENFI